MLRRKRRTSKYDAVSQVLKSKARLRRDVWVCVWFFFLQFKKNLKRGIVSLFFAIFIVKHEFEVLVECQTCTRYINQLLLIAWYLDLVLAFVDFFFFKFCIRAVICITKIRDLDFQFSSWHESGI